MICPTGKPRKLQTFFIAGTLSVIATLLLVPPASSDSDDWIISIATKHVENVLNYPDSKLQPLVKARVNFEQGLPEYSEEEQALVKAGYITEEAVPKSLYEDIYYVHSQAIGLRRYKELGIRPGTPGQIKVQIGESAVRDEEAHAAANATARVFLDAAVKKSALKSIVVSRDNFDLYIQGLQRYGFRPVRSQPGSFISATFIMSVFSDPPGRRESLGYGVR